MNTQKSAARQPQRKLGAQSDGVTLISQLPWLLRQQLNPRLRDDHRLVAVSQWLFRQTAATDLPWLDLHSGEVYARLWAGTPRPLQACCAALSRYRASAEYGLWFAQATRSQSIDALIAAHGANRMAASMVLEQLENQVASEELRRLPTNAIVWMRLKLRSQDAKPAPLRACQPAAGRRLANAQALQ